MKDKGSHIDQLFQQELSHAEFSVEGSDWEAIQGKMKAKRKRRFIWGLPLVLIVAALSTWAVWPERADNSATVHPSQVQESSSNTTRAKQTLASNHHSSENETVLNKATSRIEESVAENRGNGSFEELNGFGSNSTKARVDKVEKITQVREVEDFPLSQAKTLEESTSTLEAVRSVHFPVSYEKIEVLKAKAEGLSLSNLPDLNIKPTNLIKWSVGAQFAMQYTQLLNPVNVDENSTTPQLAVYSPNVGLKVNMHLSKWTASTGIGYQASGQRGGQYKRELYDSIPVRNPQGDTIGFFKRNYRDSIVTDDQMQFKAQYLTIPLRLGYSFNLSSKIKLGVQAGINYNYLLGTRGQLTDENDYLMSEEATQRRFGKQYFDWNTQLSLAYRMKNIELGLNGGVGQSITDPGGQLPNNYQWKQWNTGVFIKYSLPKKRTGL